MPGGKNFMQAYMQPCYLWADWTWDFQVGSVANVINCVLNFWKLFQSYSPCPEKMAFPIHNIRRPYNSVQIVKLSNLLLQ